MSKRIINLQQHGERKKPKLDVTVSDHNFPLSQNAGRSKDQVNNWADDHDDEILLLASQACEEAYNDSLLPDYSMCMQPATTSTQLFGKADLNGLHTDVSFKKPASNVVSLNSVKNNVNRIASPLPGISSKGLLNSGDMVNFSDVFKFHDKILKGQDPHNVYKQLLQIQEENAKLKSENGKLLEKCVTKEGEASILRTQLKSCQVAVDNARLEKVRFQEKSQIEWMEKISSINRDMDGLKNQLDFKNLEIISIKEKCRILESSKVKLTQVMVTNNDISSSYKNNSIRINNDCFQMNEPVKKIKSISSGVQTETKAHLLVLNSSYDLEHPDNNKLLPLILEKTSQQWSLLESNEKLQNNLEYSQKFGILSTFHIPCYKNIKDKGNQFKLIDIYQELSQVFLQKGNWECYHKILSVVQSCLLQVVDDLENISHKLTPAFMRDMDDRYLEASTTFLDVHDCTLLSGRTLFPEEQAILGRRMVSVLAYVLEYSDSIDYLEKYEHICQSGNNTSKLQIIDIVLKICNLLDITSCATLYSGLCHSIIILMRRMYEKLKTQIIDRTIDIIKFIITSRCMPFTNCTLLGLLRSLSSEPDVFVNFCPKSSLGNLKFDYEQGVLLYKKDSCILQVFYKQLESCLKCLENQCLLNRVVSVAKDLLALYCNIQSDNYSIVRDKTRCDCNLIFVQVLVYALRICAVLMKHEKINNASVHLQCESVCRSGVRLLYKCVIKDIEFSSQLSHSEGYFIEFCELMKEMPNHDECYENMISELLGTFQSSPEEIPQSYNRQAWIKSFEDFSLID